MKRQRATGRRVVGVGDPARAVRAGHRPGRRRSPTRGSGGRVRFPAEQSRQRQWSRGPRGSRPERRTMGGCPSPSSRITRCSPSSWRRRAGRFPPVDGRVEVVPALGPGLRAVVSFTGHAYVATDQSAGRLPRLTFADLAPDGFGQALDPAVLLRSGRADRPSRRPRRDAGVDRDRAGGDGPRPDIDEDGEGLARRTDLDDHPRVRHARAIRRDVRVYADERGLVTLSLGLAGRLELSIEVSESLQGNGVGRSLLRDGRRWSRPGSRCSPPSHPATSGRCGCSWPPASARSAARSSSSGDRVSA